MPIIRNEIDEIWANGVLVSATPVGRDVTVEVNGTALKTKATAALATNAAFLAQPAIPAGTLTTAQLGTALRVVRNQLDAITKENNALIRLLLNQLDDVSDT